MTFGSTWNPGSFAFYIVFKITAGSVSNEEIANSSSSNFVRLNNSSTVRIRIGDTVNNDISITNAFSVDTWHILGIEWNGSTINIYQDSKYDSPSGTADDSDEFAGLSAIGLRGNQFDGHIREMVLVDNELSTSDRNDLMSYLIDVKNT